MVSTPLPPAAKADKTLARQIAQFDEALDNATDFIELMQESAGKAPLQKDMADLRKRMKAALEATDKRVVDKTVTALIKEATKLLDAASYAARMKVFRKYKTLWGKASGLLAQALLELGAIDPPALRAPLQKEQFGLKAELDRIEKSIDYYANIDALEAMLPRIDALLKRLDGVGDAGKWMTTSYLPLLARVQTALKRVPGDRCRKSLLAELDFIEVDTNKALAKADVKAVQARAVPQLHRIEKLAARIVAASPALDRELARLAKIAAGNGNGNAAAKAKLKVLIQAKATSWPAGADADDIDKALTTFESDLAKLAQQFDKAPAEKAPAKA